jgi:hypothetical protein
VVSSTVTASAYPGAEYKDPSFTDLRTRAGYLALRPATSTLPESVKCRTGSQMTRRFSRTGVEWSRLGSNQ